MEAVLIDGNSLNLDRIYAIANGAPLIFPLSIRKRLEASRHLVEEAAKSSKAVYGINTGFGALANKKIPPLQLKELQLNLIKSHAAGYGTPLSIEESRLAITLRLNVLAKGYAGVRFALCEALHRLIQAEIYPVIPEIGSVGASGDLAPLAHLALPLLGLGMVWYEGKIHPSAEALKSAGLKPFKLSTKEGLSLINGTQIMLAVGGLALCKAKKLLKKADQITALTYEGLAGSIDSLHPLIHEVRGQQGQIDSAKQILAELKGSYLYQPSKKKSRVQDPYSIRCAPQIHGPSSDAIHYCVQIIERELNAATDNPLVFPSASTILSGGNFHGQALALAYDFAAIAIAELGNVSDRRLEVLMNPNMSGLPAFLTSKEGVNSGYMALQYLSASLVSENKLLANPASTDSIPGNIGIEDHVSMGMTSARKLKRLVENTQVILAIEMIAAAQAIDLSKAKPLGQGTAKLYKSIRKTIPMLTKDRIIAEDVAKGISILENL